MSGFAVFSLKFPSLLEFDKTARNVNHPVFQNLRNLFGVENVPSDSGLRKRLDELNPRQLRSAFNKLFSKLQRGKVLQDYKYIDGLLFFKDGELQKLLPEKSSRWEHDLLSSDAVWCDGQSRT